MGQFLILFLGGFWAACGNPPLGPSTTICILSRLWYRIFRRMEHNYWARPQVFGFSCNLNLSHTETHRDPLPCCVFNVSKPRHPSAETSAHATRPPAPARVQAPAPRAPRPPAFSCGRHAQRRKPPGVSLRPARTGRRFIYEKGVAGAEERTEIL